jgi:predicted acyltransferase
VNAIQHSSSPGDRLMSIDALRGFDMFWITGGHGLLMSAMALRGKPVPDWLTYQMEHPRWGGFTAWDLIMPLFLFVVGVSIPFASASRRRQGQSLLGLCLRMLRRVLLLFVLGMIVQGNLLAFKLDELYPFNNTLQAIAVGYLVAGVAVLILPTFGQFLLAFGLLVTFWLLMMFVPFGNSPAGTLEETANLARYIDHRFIGSHVDGTRYTWVLSSLGFAATVLMGVLGGHILRSNMRPAVRVGCLGAAGLGCLLGGWLWSFHFPIIKPIWTSSMALWAGGWSFLLLGVFYLVIDVWGYRRWAFPFVVIGMNAIVAYMIWHTVNLGTITHRFLAGVAGHLSKESGAFLLTVGPVALLWLTLFYMYRKRTFVRV